MSHENVESIAANLHDCSIEEVKNENYSFNLPLLKIKNYSEHVFAVALFQNKNKLSIELFNTTKSFTIFSYIYSG